MSDKKQETFEFQAEVKQLLHILAFSLYTHKEVFVRELVSNASDALNKVNYLLLTDKAKVFGEGAELSIKIDFDKKTNVLSIKDTGIGMTKEEIINNIGTIAKSGTKAFLEKMKAENKDNADIIGQFGVGFYSAFIVADKVEVCTKSYIKEEPAYRWISDGTGKYTLEEIDKNDRGTEIKIYLKKEETEFLEKERIKSVIQKYSNFLRYPIYIETEKANELEAIWSKTPSTVKEEEYKEFYKFLSHGSDETFFKIHKVADAPFQFSYLLYCPTRNFNMMFQSEDAVYGLNLYSNKVLIQEECKDLIPKYFRFIKGVVDSSDIPLNISRETIQNNFVVQKIKNIITKSIISELEKLLKKDKEKYKEFYKEFQRELKEGTHSDFSNQEKLAGLLLFQSSHSEKEEDLFSIKEYIERIKEGQKEIYYISGVDRKSIEKSPYLEIFKKKNVEVLYLIDPADEIVLSSIPKYKDMEFKSIENSNIDFVKNLKSDDSKVEEKEEVKIDKKKFKDFVKFYKDLLKDKVLDVVETDRLVDSPCCLVNPQNNMSAHIEKMMKMMNKDFQGSKKILQINPKNSFIAKLADLFEKDKDSQLLHNLGFQLFDNTLLLEGEVPDPAETNSRLQNIMMSAVENELIK